MKTSMSKEKGKERNKKTRQQGPTLLFDLDGTLIDSVYQHILAWREALDQVGMLFSNALIHRRIGLSGDLLVRSFVRDSGRKFKSKELDYLKKLHADAYKKREGEIRLLPGAHDLISALSKLDIPIAIGTSGKREDAEKPLDMLGVDKTVVVVTADDVQNAKPAPDLFLACAEKLGVDIKDCMVVGDSTWDILAAQRARTLGVGLLSGGFSEDELLRAGAYRVYRDPADLLLRLDELGIQPKK
jgi:HAD superfamily hydrolase (TIGR01549 family)